MPSTVYLYTIINITVYNYYNLKEDSPSELNANFICFISHCICTISLH